MSQGEMTFKRTTRFIQRGFQTRMIAKSVALLAVMALLSSVILYFLAGSELQASYYEAHASIESLWDKLFPVVLITNVASFVVIAIVTVFVILYVSHKIAGPLYKLEHSLAEIGGGNLDLRIVLRQGDQIKALASAVNGMLETFSEKIRSVKDVAQEMSRLEESMRHFGNGEPISSDEAKKIHLQLKECLDKLNTELSMFRLRVSPDGQS